MYTIILFCLCFLVPSIIGAVCQHMAKKRLEDYSQVANSLGWTGAQAAYNMLAANNINNVPIQVGNPGEDFYDPKSNSITLSEECYNYSSVTAIAVACHEAGHACQTAAGNEFVKVRNALVPVCNIANYLWLIIIILGIILHITGLWIVGVVVFSLTFLFQLVTLPTELDASKRAEHYLQFCNIHPDEASISHKILRSCAWTYIAALIASAGQLLWIILRSR